MLRFIIEVKEKCGHSGYEGSYFKTIDLDVPELEQELSRGGFSENSYLSARLVAAEVLDCPRNTK